MQYVLPISGSHRQPLLISSIASMISCAISLIPHIYIAILSAPLSSSVLSQIQQLLISWCWIFSTFSFVSFTFSSPLKCRTDRSCRNRRYHTTGRWCSRTPPPNRRSILYPRTFRMGLFHRPFSALSSNLHRVPLKTTPSKMCSCQIHSEQLYRFTLHVFRILCFLTILSSAFMYLSSIVVTPSTLPGTWYTAYRQSWTPARSGRNRMELL